MLTPAFELKQDPDFLTIYIKAPFAKISETEIFIEDSDFKFYSKPYFLRLTLPGNIVEDGREKADYDPEKGSFTIKVPKQKPGEEFEGLDMLTKLLAPKGSDRAAPPMIEVIDQGEGDSATDSQTLPADDTEEFDWCVEQTLYEEQPCALESPKYGFANQKSGVFHRLQDELRGVVDIRDPDKKSKSEKQEERMADEQSKFDEDHYLADLFEDDGVQHVLSYTPSWEEELQFVQQGTPVDVAVVFTEEEKEKMRKLPRKEYILSKTEENLVFLGLVDIIFAYCYNHRMTEGENNVESSWTISKLSATLSWLETFSTIQDVIQTSFRRCLCYPLFRHWKLNEAVLQDTKHIFSLGRRKLLQCLLEVHSLLIDTDARYILNDLYITDYCVWIQSAREKKINSLSEALEKVHLCKEDVDFNLLEIERIAKMVMSGDIEEITDGLNNVSVTSKEVKDSDDDSTDNDDESTTDSDVTTDSDDESTDNDDSNTEIVDGENTTNSEMHLPNISSESCTSTVNSDCSVDSSGQQKK